jgi:excisionase family DNA binding protein
MIPADSQSSELKSQDRLLKVPEVMFLLSYSRATIYRLVNAGNLPYVRCGGTIRFRHQSILKWMQDRESGPGAVHTY